MINALITDVSYVLLQPKDESYSGSLNALYKAKKDTFNFKFFDYFRINTELLEFFTNLSRTIPIYILTSDTIQNDKELLKYWDKTIQQIFSASEMGTHKSQPEAYSLVLNKLQLKAEEVIYIDDNENNIKAATSVGLVTIIHKFTKETISEVERFL